MPPTPPPDPKRAPTDPLERQIQRVEKLAGFGAQLAGALRTEFIYYWDHPQRRIEVPESGPFVAKVEALRTLTGKYLREIARCHHLPPVQQTHVLKQLDLNALLEAGKGLEATARILRDRGRERGWGSGRGFDTAAPWATADGWLKLFGAAGQPEHAPKDAAAGGGWLTGKLAGMLERAVTTVVPKPEKPPPPLHPGARRLQAFENALQLVSEILAETGPRLGVLRIALARNAGEDVPVPGRLPAELADTIPDVAASLKERPPMARAAGIAVQQGVMAKKMYEEYKAGLEAAKGVAPDKVGEILRPFPVDKLKGVVMPLTNLHMTFRAIPAVEGLFPPPQVRKLEIAMPTSEADRRAVEPDEAPEPVAEAAKEAEKPAKLSRQELSERRLSLIMTYMTDPESNPALSDEALVYRLVAEEREYQLDRKVDLRMRIRFLGPPSADEPPETAAERTQMEADMKQAEEYEAQLQELLGYVAQSREEQV